MNRGTRPFISGEQGNKSLKLKGIGEQRNTEDQDFDLEEQGKMPIFLGEQGNRYPLGGPQEWLRFTRTSINMVHYNPFIT